MKRGPPTRGLCECPWAGPFVRFGSACFQVEDIVRATWFLVFDHESGATRVHGRIVVQIVEAVRADKVFRVNLIQFVALETGDQHDVAPDLGSVIGLVLAEGKTTVRLALGEGAIGHRLCLVIEHHDNLPAAALRWGTAVDSDLPGEREHPGRTAMRRPRSPKPLANFRLDEGGAASRLNCENAF